jgi:LysM repeat protein
MRFGLGLAALFLIVVLAVSTCGRAPAVAPDTGVESADPEVGGGAGADTGPQTPVPTPTITREGSPRLEDVGTAVAATADAPATPTPSPTVAPTLSSVTPSPLPTEVVPTDAAPSATPEPPTATPEPPTPTPGGERTHVVQAGENLYRIGLLYGLSWVAIAEYNGITNPNTITVGQELRIPPSPTATPATESSAPAGDAVEGVAAESETPAEPPANKPLAAGAPAPVKQAETPPSATGDEPTATAGAPVVASPPVHAVAAGDTLYGISQQYGVDWAQVAEANGLATPNQLYPGQLLKIPPDVPGPTPEFNHRVHNGETLSALARQYGLSADDLAAANGLSAPYTIYSGQTLIIPSD